MFREIEMQSCVPKRYHDIQYWRAEKQITLIDLLDHHILQIRLSCPPEYPKYSRHIGTCACPSGHYIKMYLT
ncbi:Uncharacterized protein HZ326_16746 [Fusarium oxysporum f. sp. albedinis]|nr:Uncharacterized protein HZ326_16746 [Fusarium oxysporum f. sp. albedinis]